MDWVNRMNKAIDYIEEHLTDEIDKNEICKIIGCSFSMFQGAFSQITGISVSEYIRRRRLTCAAQELQNTEQKIIEIAIKYGYQSADAFSVAFKRIHGINPSNVRNHSVPLTFYCRLNFELTLKGVQKMNYTIIERKPFKVIGIRRTTPYGAGTWAVVKSDGSNEKIRDLSGHFYDLGLCFGFSADGSNDYMCAVEWNKETPETLDSFEYPSATWLKFEAVGTVTGQTLTNVWHRINNEFLTQSKYKKSGLPTIEKYVVWDEASDICNVEIWIPVAEK